MDFLTIIAHRNTAFLIVDKQCGEAATKDPYAWAKLDRVRAYLRDSTIAEVDEYLREEATNDKP